MRTISAIVLAAILSGCLGQHEYRPIHFYDLQTRFSATPASQTPAAAPALNALVVVGSLRMAGPPQTKMICRVGSHRIEPDEYNRWVQPPEDLIAKELSAAVGQRFSCASCRTVQREATLSGSVLAIETTPGQKARLALRLTLVDVSNGARLLSKVYDRSEPLGASKPSAFADAAATALESIITDALGDIEESLRVNVR